MDDTKRAAVQENTILRLRITIAEQARDIVRLERMHEHNQRMINRLQGQIRKLQKDPAIMMFKKGADE